MIYERISCEGSTLGNASRSSHQGDHSYDGGNNVTILVDWQIADEIESGRILLEPYDEKLIQPNSLDVCLGSIFSTYSVSDVPIDPYMKDSVEYGLIENLMAPIELCKGGFLLGETLERISLPRDICCQIEGKSSLARLGLSIHQTGGWIDNGFSGTITLEFGNENNRPIILHPGMPIAQLIFHRTESCLVSYAEKKGAKYMYQSGPTASKFYENAR